MKPNLLPLALGAILSLPGCWREDATSGAPPSVAAAPPGAAFGLPAKLCVVLDKVAPEVRELGAAGAQARLVTSIAEAFDYQHDSLARVTSEIDAIASSGCPAARGTLLSVIKMNTLQEAVR